MLKRQVNRLLFRRSLVRNLQRFYSYDDDQSKCLYPLLSRGLLQIHGPDSTAFLQGLITNDMNHFQDGAHSIYAMFLNSKGRVLYDTLIHKWGHENKFMIECDKSVHDLLRKHLEMFKLRRNVKISDVSQYFKIWTLLTPADTEIEPGIDITCNINVYKDPRLQELGYRLITTTNVDHFDLQNVLGKDTVFKDNEIGYTVLKYKLGVGEGADDLYPGTCFPLEVNCDYLHGVSFHKGCYIGQETTARIHHTGVVRKRLMPLRFLETNSIDKLETDAPIWAAVDPGRTKIGKFKSFMNGYGLGLVRIKEALEAKSLTIGLNPVEITKPPWWPIEARKEKIKPKYEQTQKIQENDMEDSKPKEETVLIYDFKCVSCGIDEKAHYKGTNPPFSRNIVLKYPSYVMKDPFSLPGKGEIVVLGTDCVNCGVTVCISKGCSLFYKKSYCLDCANKLNETFPVEIKSKLAQIKKKCK